MLSFIFDNQKVEINCKNEIIVIQSKNPNLFLRKILESLRNKNLINFGFNSYSKFLNFSYLSKLSDFISLNKNNFLYREISSEINIHDFFNSDKLFELVSKYNDYFKLDLISFYGDDLKSIFDLLKIEKEFYLDSNLIIKILEISKSETKQLVVINQIYDLKISDLIKFSNYYDFLILTSDIRYSIPNSKYLEICVLFNETKCDYLLMEDKEIIYDFLEKQTGVEINDSIFDSYLSEENNIKNSNIFYFLNKII